MERLTTPAWSALWRPTSRCDVPAAISVQGLLSGENFPPLCECTGREEPVPTASGRFLGVMAPLCVLACAGCAPSYETLAS